MRLSKHMGYTTGKTSNVVPISTMTRPLLITAVCALLAISSSIERTATAAPREEVTASGLEDLLTPRRPIPYALLGVNAFANDARFGSIRSQLNEVRSTLGLRRIRVLFAWDDNVQPTPTSQPNFAFYDQIARSIPSGTKALVILTGVPSWIRNSKNWKAGDPRATFVDLWVKKVVARYARYGRIEGFQIWNEPNNPDIVENTTLDLLTKPDNYVELLARSHAASKAIAPRKLVINAATTAIAQGFPSTLNYNKRMVEEGILSFTDAYAIHFYGKSVERILFGGVGSFLNSLSKPIWVTEIGKQGTTKQLDYAERIIPFLKTNIPRISRMYLYQFTDSAPASTTYGLRNLTPQQTVSDLYIKLRERRQTIVQGK